MSKVLIQQVLVGKGHLPPRGDDYDYVFLKDIAIPSVEAYAKKFGYDHDVCNDISEIVENLPQCYDRNHHNNMKYTYQKYITLEKAKDYDFILLLDSDCFIMNYTPQLPLSPGVSVRDIDHYRSNDADLKNRFTVSNAGFQLYDKVSALKMNNYIKNRIKEIIKVNDLYFHDEIDLARLLDMDLSIQFNIVGDDWNHIKQTGFNVKYVPKKFIYHYAGGRKHARFQNMMDNNWIDLAGNYLR